MISKGFTTRFDWVLAGKMAGPDPKCDLKLADFEGVSLIPSIGSLVPGWLLAVPNHISNCAYHLDCKQQTSLVHSLHFAREIISQYWQNKPFFFEHGAMHSGSTTGCGVDQTHIHVVPLGIPLLEISLKDVEIDWIEVDPKTPWKRVKSRDYYLISDFERAFVGHPNQKTSQFFRKKIATHLSITEQWNYKKYPHYENSEITIRNICQEGIGHLVA